MCRVCMGRVCYVPSLLSAEFVMCRVDPTPHRITGVRTPEGVLISRAFDSF